MLSAILSESGYSVVKSLSVDGAIEIIQKQDIDTVITDLKMPGKDGMQLFDYIMDNNCEIPVIFLTAYGTVDSAAHAVTMGAFYYFIKPPDYTKLKDITAKAVKQRLLKKEIDNLTQRLKGENNYRIIGSTPDMQKIFQTVEAIKNSASSVLISGDTGTGKERIARLLHYKSPRKNMPFIAVNCAAMPKELIEAELFGNEKGAFTGAVSTRIGKFEEASEGTILLDEIGELELSLQAKLLRVLEEREIERLGSNKKIKVSFRLISSSNLDLKKMVNDGKFREDLFYRINVVQIKLPLLVERKDDIPLLASEFLEAFCYREKKVLSLSADVMNIFQNYPWPGNIRQLKNVIERAVVLAKNSKITPKELPEELLAYNDSVKVKSGDPLQSMQELQINAIKNALKVCKGNKSKAARQLGISRKALYKRLKDL